VAVLGMDMVRGLSGFGGSEEFCKLGDSDLNSFCCMLRMLVAMVKEEREGDEFKRTHARHAYIHSFHPSPQPFHFDDISMTSFAF
jgi:hypothetical protein